MANQLRVTLISTELAYIVFAVSGFCSTMETSEPSVFWRLFFMSEAKRVHAGRRELVGSAGTVDLPGFSQRPLIIEGETWQA